LLPPRRPVPDRDPSVEALAVDRRGEVVALEAGLLPEGERATAAEAEHGAVRRPGELGDREVDLRNPGPALRDRAGGYGTAAAVERPADSCPWRPTHARRAHLDPARAGRHVDRRPAGR